MNPQQHQKNRINLIIVSPGFPANEEDTTCLPFFRMFVRQLQALDKFSISVIALQYPPVKQKYSWFGINVYPIGGSNKRGLFKIANLISAWLYLKKLKQNNAANIVLSFLATDAALVAGYFCKVNRIKHFCWMVGQDALKTNRYMSLMAKDTVFMAISGFLKQTAEKNFKIKINTVLSNGINLLDVPPFEALKKDIDFVCVGSLIKLKRADWVINLMNDLTKENLKLSCLIIGDGPEKEILQHQINKFQLQDRIKLTGSLPHDEVIKLMFKSRILLHPSSYEGFSTVCIEALYAACHVITTCNPLSEINAQMHAVNNYNDFYTKAKQLLVNEQTFKSYADYTTEKTAMKFLELM